MLRRKDRDRLARFLGWFSVGLGAAEVAAPRAMCRLVGANGKGKAPAVMRAMGVRELAAGAGILTRARPTNFMWSRVAGDALDLALLGAVAAMRNRRLRTAFAIANVAAVAAPDLFEARFLSQKQGTPESGQLIRKTVTIAKTREQVEEAWTAAADLRAKVDAHAADVSFLEAPGNRGTELAVEWREDPRAGEFAVMFGKLTGRDLATQLSDDLRNFKARLETGEVIRSEGAPTGHKLAGHVLQRPARPLEREAVAA